MWQIYICQKDKKCLCILCLSIDDMLIVRSDDEMIRFTKNILKFSFDMQDMGLADVILGIKSQGHLTDLFWVNYIMWTKFLGNSIKMILL